MKSGVLRALIVACVLFAVGASAVRAQALKISVQKAPRLASVGIASPQGSSPAGRYMAFAYTGPAPGQNNLKIVDTQGRVDTLFWSRNASFLPSDRGVIYWREDPAALGLCRMSLPSTQSVCLYPSDLSPGGIGFLGYDLDLNRAGTEIATSKIMGDGSTAIFALRLSDGWLRPVAPFGSNPIWSPDDRRIAFEAPYGGASMVWIANGDGSAYNPVRPGKLIGWTRGNRGVLILGIDGMSVFRADVTGRTNRPIGVFPYVTEVSSFPEVSISPSGGYLLGVSDGRPVIMNLTTGNVMTLAVAGAASPFWGRSDYVIYYRSGLDWYVARIALGRNPPVE